jgi:predicted Zn-dependent peptidase
VEDELDKIKSEPVAKDELQKVKNKTESTITFEDMSVMSRAASLAYYEILGDAAWMNDELNKYAAITENDILQESKKIFKKKTAALYIICQITKKTNYANTTPYKRSGIKGNTSYATTGIFKH